MKRFHGGFNGAETNCRIAHNLGILLMNSNCIIFINLFFLFFFINCFFFFFFQQHSSYVCSDIFSLVYSGYFGYWELKVLNNWAKLVFLLHMHLTLPFDNHNDGQKSSKRCNLSALVYLSNIWITRSQQSPKSGRIWLTNQLLDFQ